MRVETGRIISRRGSFGRIIGRKSQEKKDLKDIAHASHGTAHLHRQLGSSVCISSLSHLFGRESRFFIYNMTNTSVHDQRVKSKYTGQDYWAQWLDCVSKFSHVP